MLPNIKHLIMCFQDGALSRGEFALLVLMGFGGHRFLADAHLLWANVHAPSASAEWLPFDLLVIAVMVALTPVPNFGPEKKQTVTAAHARGAPKELARVSKKLPEQKRAA